MNKENILYITDNSENRTAIVIPIKEWEELQANYISLSKRELLDDKTSLDWLNNLPMSCLVQLVHVNEVIQLLSKMELYTKEQWLEIYSKYYIYYDSLNKKEIQLLYFFRKYLYMPEDEEEIEKHLNFLKDEYRLSSYTGNELSLSDYKKLIDKFTKVNEISFLQYFLINYKIQLTTSDTTRLKRKAERDRLFIYDVLNFLDDSIETINNVIDNDSIELGRKRILNNIANVLYNGNKSQVYRAKQEALNKLDIL